MRTAIALLLACSPLVWAAEPESNPKFFHRLSHYRLDVPAASLKDAMQRFADATSAQVIFGSQDALGVRTNAVKGRLQPEEALQRMLAGTELTYRFDQLGRVVIVSRLAGASRIRMRERRPVEPANFRPLMRPKR